MHKRRDYIYLTLAAVMLLAGCLTMLLWKTGSRPTPQQELASAHVTVPKTDGVVLTVEKVITAEVVSDGLKDLGRLITEEYYFTDVLSYSSDIRFFKLFAIPFTTSSFLVSYDGVVTAGIDFEKIEVTKDEERKIITIALPPAEIMNVDIDPESFVPYSEKTGLGNPISAGDFNDALKELEAGVKEKALDKGILERAEENAKKVVTHFVESLFEPGTYTIRYT